MALKLRRISEMYQWEEDSVEEERICKIQKPAAAGTSLIAITSYKYD